MASWHTIFELYFKMQNPYRQSPISIRSLRPELEPRHERSPAACLKAAEANMTDTRDWFTNPPPIVEHHAATGPRDVEAGWPPRFCPGVDDNVAIPKAVFEKIFLNPPTEIRNELRNLVANPTPLGLIGFLVATFPVSFALMGVAGAGGSGACTSGLSFYFGGGLQLIAALLEFIMGNTFSFLLFGAFGRGGPTQDIKTMERLTFSTGAAWLALSGVPGVQAAYLQQAGEDEAKRAALEAEFNASFGKADSPDESVVAADNFHQLLASSRSAY